MARTGRPAKRIELHKRPGTYRPDRHGPKPMLASPPLVRRSLVYTVPFADHQVRVPGLCRAGGPGVVRESVVALCALRHRGHGV
jgi:hypothetical protein